jgi:hypothetical protein
MTHYILKGFCPYSEPFCWFEAWYGEVFEMYFVYKEAI